MSSANDAMKACGIFFIGMSPIDMKYKRGPITDPYGTPDEIGAGSENTPLALTIICVLAERKNSIYTGKFYVSFLDQVLEHSNSLLASYHLLKNKLHFSMNLQNKSND